jgi:hypothetical protein
VLAVPRISLRTVLAVPLSDNKTDVASRWKVTQSWFLCLMEISVLSVLDDKFSTCSTPSGKSASMALRAINIDLLTDRWPYAVWASR